MAETWIGAMTAVKARRPYHGERRRLEAQLTRARILDAAESRFLQSGYSSTTIADIAADAAVSADTIYKSFGGKPGLVRAIHERALVGESPVPAEERSDHLQASERDPRQIIRGWGSLVAELAPRSAPILLLVREASAADPELQALLHELDASRHRRMTANARRLRDAGHLRAGVSLQQAADVLWTYSSPELYDLLVDRRGMQARRYGEFVAEAMIAALL